MFERTALALLLTACAHTGTATPTTTAPPPADAAPWAVLGELTVPDLPLWTNKYADDRDDFGIFVQVDNVMETHGLSRLDAVEVQNHFRDGWRAGERDVTALFADAVARVKAGDRESGLDPDRLASGRFTVVFDLDETLYDQYYDMETGAACHSIAFAAGNRIKHIHFAPGWETAFDTVRALGGRIVLFSANVDDTNYANLSRWMWEGTPLTEHPDIEGIFTNSYLTLQSKDEGKKPAPVTEPSKDLRLFDEDLDSVILVDDNPNRVFHYANLRVTRKFHADAWCLPDVDPPLKAALGGALEAVSAELRDAVAWMDAHPDGTFQQAMLPFSWTGRVAVDALVVSNGWTREAAIAYVRAHPDAADKRF